MICKKCGAEMQDEALVCDVCGAAVENEEVETAEVVETVEEEVVVDDAVEAEEASEEVAEEASEEVASEEPDETAEEEGVGAVEDVVEEIPVPAKKNTFVRVGIPLVVVAVIAIACVVSMFFLKGNNKYVATLETVITDATPGPSGAPEVDKLEDLRFFEKEQSLKVDELLYRYYASQSMNQMQQYYAQYGMSVDYATAESMFAELEKSVFDNVYVKLVLLLEKKADEKGYELTEEGKVAAENNIKQYVEQSLNTEAGETFESAKDTVLLKNFSMTYNEFLEINLRVSRVAEFLKEYPKSFEFTEEELKAAFEDLKKQYETRKVKHILIKNTDANDEPFKGAKLARKKALAESLAKQINRGVNIDKLIKKYSEDVDAKGKPNSDTGKPGEYTVTMESNFVTEFMDWALAHMPKDKAEVVETQYGYHVMKVTSYKLSSTYEEQKDVLPEFIVSAELDRIIQKLVVTDKNEKALERCKYQILGMFPTPAPEAETTPAPVEATAAAQ